MKFDRIRILMITTVIYICSIFTNNKLIFAIAISIWVSSVGYNVAKMMQKHKFGMEDLGDELYKRSHNDFAKKKYASALMNIITFPMIIIGLLCIMGSLGCIWALAFK